MITAFSRNLKYLRTMNGETQEELAKAVHLSKMAISRYENGENEPNLDALINLSYHFKITVDEFIKTTIKPLYIRNIRQFQKKYEISDREMAMLMGYKDEELKRCLQIGIESFIKGNIEKLAEYFGVEAIGELFVTDFFAEVLHEK